MPLETRSVYEIAVIPWSRNSVAVRRLVAVIVPFALNAFVAFVALVALVAQAGAQGGQGDASAPRIVSLMPSLTEDLFAIGAGRQVVAVSQFSDYPPAATRLPRVASFSALDAERIVRLHPALVVGIPAQSALIASLRRVGLRVELLPDDTFDDLFANLRRLGELSGHQGEAAKLSRALRARTAMLIARVPPGARPRTFVVLGVDPIYTVGAGSYIAHLIALAGGTNAAALRDPYARYSAEALLAAHPDALVADRTSGFASVRDRSPWSALQAVRDGRAYILDNADILERPGPRYNDGLAWLIARLHPHAAR